MGKPAPRLQAKIIHDFAVDFDPKGQPVGGATYNERLEEAIREEKEIFSMSIRHCTVVVLISVTTAAIIVRHDVDKNEGRIR